MPDPTRNLSSHLSAPQRTNLGSFYTPPRIVRLVYELLARVAPADFADVVLEPACGYGAFFGEAFPQPGVRLIGADVDDGALAIARETFPRVSFRHANALEKISRAKYGIGDEERLVIVGNPPYNDVTSQAKNRVKTSLHAVDDAVRARDLGLSSLLAMAKLRPDYIAVLHPLSYLIKKANFRVLRAMMRDYVLRDAVIFSSQVFAKTSANSEFPIVAAVYEKDPAGTSYERIWRHKFRVMEGGAVALSDYDYICRHIAKYPSKRSARSRPPEALRFYTMRDINALKRSRTFIWEDTANTLYIDPAKLPYYCYVDAFKDIAKTLPYHLGNFDVMIDHAAFQTLKDDFLALSIAKHPAIFAGHFSPPDPHRLQAARARVDRYFQTLFGHLEPKA